MGQENICSQSPIVSHFATIFTRYFLQIPQTRSHDVNVLIRILNFDSQVLTLVFLQLLDLCDEWKGGNQSCSNFNDVLNRSRFIGLNNFGRAYLDLFREDCVNKCWIIYLRANSPWSWLVSDFAINLQLEQLAKCRGKLFQVSGRLQFPNKTKRTAWKNLMQVLEATNY